MKPCIDCGEPTEGSRCPEHDRNRRPGPPPRQNGYDSTWDKLSKRARRLQPFCTDCYTTEDLTTDHTPRAWQRKAEGKPIRLRDVAVVCRSCNSKRGAARGEQTRGGTPAGRGAERRGEAKRPLHTPGGMP